MRKNLLKLLALPLVVGLMAGCSSDDDNTPVEPTTCVYHVSQTEFTVGDSGEFTAWAMKGEEKITDVVADPATVDTTEAKIVNITLSSATCADAGAIQKMVVSESTNPPFTGKILPF